jgi:hypothetical protein
MGQAVMVSAEPSNHDLSSVQCGKDGCYIAWDNAQDAGHIALMRTNGSFLWRRSLGDSTARPNLLLADERALLAWYDGKHVLAAPLSTAGPGEPSVIGRVAGVLHLPPPRIAPDPDAKGRWYVSWLTYETAVKEPFIARVDCR